MKVGSLFSGIGGIDLGLERAGMTVKWQVEKDDYCQRVLAKHWPRVPRYNDIRLLDPRSLERVDLICGGAPCQPHSVAGKRKGKADTRDLWPEFSRIIRGVNPAWVLIENVPGIRTTIIDDVLADLEEAHYAAWPLVVGAWAVGAPHRRDRVWIIARRVIGSAERHLAYPDCQRERDANKSWGLERAGGTGVSAAGGSRADGVENPDGAERWPSTESYNGNGADARRGEAAGGPRVSEPDTRGVGQSDPCFTGLAFRQEQPAWQECAAFERSGDERVAHPTLIAQREPNHEASTVRWCWSRESAGGRSAEIRWPARPGEPQYDWEAPRLVADALRTNDGGQKGPSGRGRGVPPAGTAGNGERQTEPQLGGSTDGLPRRLARHRVNALKALGNAVVPQVVEAIGRAIMEAAGC